MHNILLVMGLGLILMIVGFWMWQADNTDHEEEIEDDQREIERIENE